VTSAASIAEQQALQALEREVGWVQELGKDSADASAAAATSAAWHFPLTAEGLQALFTRARAGAASGAIPTLTLSASCALAGILDYLAAELWEVTGGDAKLAPCAAGGAIVQPRHFLRVVQSDAELEAFFTEPVLAAALACSALPCSAACRL
jgi:hypothetical protein